MDFARKDVSMLILVPKPPMQITVFMFDPSLAICQLSGQLISKRFSHNSDASAFIFLFTAEIHTSYIPGFIFDDTECKEKLIRHFS